MEQYIPEILPPKIDEREDNCDLTKAAFDAEELLKEAKIRAAALDEVMESVREIVTLDDEVKTKLDYASASADGLSKALTVTTISAALVAELIIQKIREKD
ncbi:MAG: hypothetical protein Q4C84_16765 [Bacillota bacterium]|nr:hypothetical protein [Bacillota bacterium]